MKTKKIKRMSLERENSELKRLIWMLYPIRVRK
jgi:hypothetical protein